MDFLEKAQVTIKEVDLSEVPGDDKLSTASFIISTRDIYAWEKIKYALQANLNEKISFDTGLSALSLIGEGFNRHNRTLLQTIELLADNQVPVLGITTTSFRISLLVPADRIERSVALCHARWVTDGGK